jgi:histidinol-phosphate/aromatic aminotransferase/cobyric acid decarboxylase-like protein/predicted GNAT family N-acyltransferase
MNVQPNNILPPGLRFRMATPEDRQQIYAVRHEVYALELGQHHPTQDGRLSDALDAFNEYVVAERDGKLAGFISITSPNYSGYSVDKYFPRGKFPFPVNERLYEVRLLTVLEQHRGTKLAYLLMLAALEHVERSGGNAIVAIGRLNLLSMYEAAGLRPLGQRATSGAVEYELLYADTRDLRRRAEEFLKTSPAHMGVVTLPAPSQPTAATHGGHSFEAIGTDLCDLSRRHDVIAADVLDAWFDPAPAVVAALTEHLAWTVRTSPPVGGRGLAEAIAARRGVPVGCLALGAGSSDLIFRGLQKWLTAQSKVLILDPMYSEYAHVLEGLVKCQVDRLTLRPEDDFRLQTEALAAKLRSGYDWVFLVNPNNPTGHHVPRREMEEVLAMAPSTTRFWIDETYVDFMRGSESLEGFASASQNVLVCKSMSKAYALSGVRVGYLCGPQHMMADLQTRSPPWAVSLPGQIAAIAALKETAYYEARWQETRDLAQALRRELQGLGWTVWPSCGNFLLCQVADSHPAAAIIAEKARAKDLFLRTTEGMGRSLGGRMLRVAVKDQQTNARMVAILKGVLDGRDDQAL